MKIIYKTTNLINNKIYIGQHTTDNINDDYLGSGKLISYAIKKYGKEKFQKEILEECKTKNDLDKREKYWIKKLKPEYNLVEGGTGGYNYFAVIANKLKRTGKTWEEIYGKETSIKLKTKLHNRMIGNKLTLNKEPWNKGKIGYKIKGRTNKSKEKSSMSLKNSQKHKEAMRNPETRKKLSIAAKRTVTELWKNNEYVSKVMKSRKKYYNDNPKVKKEDLLKLLNSNKSVTEIISILGVSIPTYYKYKKIYIGGR